MSLSFVIASSYSWVVCGEPSWCDPQAFEGGAHTLITQCPPCSTAVCRNWGSEPLLALGFLLSHQAACQSFPGDHCMDAIFAIELGSLELSSGETNHIAKWTRSTRVHHNW